MTRCTGAVCQLSERPLLCASVDWSLGEAAIGGSDHAVYIVDAATCKLKRTLHKQGGHAEWVRRLGAEARSVHSFRDSNCCRSRVSRTLQAGVLSLVGSCASQMAASRSISSEPSAAQEAWTPSCSSGARAMCEQRPCRPTQAGCPATELGVLAHDLTKSRPP